MNLSVVTLSFRDDVLGRLFTTMERLEAGTVRRVIVGDNGLSVEFRAAWPQARYVPVSANPFVAASAINRCVEAAPPGHDLLMVWDDAELLTPGWASRVEEAFRAWPMEYGLATLSQTTSETTYGLLPSSGVFELPEIALGPSLVIPRRVFDEIGPWDETFVGYGYDEWDYGLRLLHAGYRIGLLLSVRLRDPAQAAGWVERFGSYEAVLDRAAVNCQRFYQKWFGSPPPVVLHRPVTAEHFKRARCRCAFSETWWTAPPGGER